MQRDDKVIEAMSQMSKLIKNGKKNGVIKCPFCGGNIQYAYENVMAMRAKCDHCDFKIMA